jgi:hypothetical protein
MKKKQVVKVKLPSANKIAANLRGQFPRNKLTGDDRAYSIANGLARMLSTIGPNDVNKDLFSVNDLKYNSNVWTQVRNILAKGVKQ